MTVVPVLLTFDIHTHTQPPAQVDRDLSQARAMLREHRWPATFLFPSRSAEILPHHVVGVRDEGHEVGCHGCTHEPEENFAALPTGEQRAVLGRATDRLGEILGERPITFRAPAFKIGGATVGVLDELGYQADLSVTAGRLGVFGSDVYNWRPLVATRRPYHPSSRNPYRRGAARLWEIPVSALVLPFLSNTERFLGLPFMKCFFRTLYVEARTTGKPIVFVLHAEDLNAAGGIEEVGRLTWKHFVPTRAHGLQFRFFLMERNWTNVHRDIVALLRYMESFRGVRYMTVREYLPILRRVA